ncbi:MAG: SLC13 family permease, partial [Candidatus Eisenbacteria sp.]|nr:SLC13 family permease [Candidatus Eisenbacteria bacterium]
MEMLALTVILVLVIALYITKRLSIEVTSLLIPPALFLTGILDVPSALSGFSSSATVTIGALFIVSAGLTRTGTLEFLTEIFKRYSRGDSLRLLVIMALTVPVISAFMNNIPVVAMLLPVILALARDIDIRPSKLMIPLSYFAILGGTCTLIGTGTNILVHDIYSKWQADEGLPVTGFGMFEFSPLGLVLLAAGAAFIILVGRRTLPNRASLSGILPRERTAKFVTEILIEGDSLLLEKRVDEVFGVRSPIRLLEIIRTEEVTLGAAAQGMHMHKDDALIIEGTSKDITEFLSEAHASLASVVEDDRRVPMRTMELMLGEAVVLPDSPFVGRTVGDLALNKHFGIKVLAIQRGARHHRMKIRHAPLKPGDVLLLQASANGFSALHESESVLLVEGLESIIKHKRRATVAIAILLSVV